MLRKIAELKEKKEQKYKREQMKIEREYREKIIRRKGKTKGRKRIQEKRKRKSKRIFKITKR